MRRALRCAPESLGRAARAAAAVLRHRLGRRHRGFLSLARTPDRPEVVRILIGLLSGLFTAILSSTIVANALPRIVAELDGTPRQYTWVVTSALLTMTITTPIWGKASDLLDKTAVVYAAIILFAVATLLAGLARSMPELIAWRALQGVGMGGLMAGAQTIIGSIVAPRERGRYAGYLGATMVLATVSGPLLGGVIVDAPGLGWRWTFFVCLPFSVLSLVLLRLFLRIDWPRRRVRLDPIGALGLAVTAALPLVWVTVAGDLFAWWSLPSAAFGAGTLVGLAVTVVAEARHREPLVDLRVITSRPVGLAIIACLATGVSMFGGAVFLGQYFQLARGLTPTEAGLATIPFMLGSFVGTTGAGMVVTRTGRPRPIVVAGSVLLAGSATALAVIDHASNLAWALPAIALLGLGTGLLLQNLVLIAQNAVDVTVVGATSAAVAFFRSLGGAVGVAVLGAVVAAFVEARVPGLGAAVSDPGSLPAAVQQAARIAYGEATGLVFAGFAVIGLVGLVSTLALPDVRLRSTIRKLD